MRTWHDDNIQSCKLLSEAISNVNTVNKQEFSAFSKYLIEKIHVNVMMT